MPRFRAGPCSIGAAVALLVSATVVATGQSPGLADVSAVQGSAYGFFANVSLFGGPPAPRGPAPTVTLAGDASNSPQTAMAATSDATYGPARLFSSGPTTVTTQGTIGAGGSATSTATIQNVNTSGQEVFTATSIASTCSATEAGNTGSTAVVGGTLITSEGDPNVDGDETVVPVPANPAPNTTINGTIEGVGDAFRYVFNEQIVNPDGSLTVNAAHLFLLGPTAIGDLIIGQSICGVTATVGPTTTTTTGASTTSTTSTTPTTVASTTTTTVGTGRVRGSASGYFASVGLFGGPANTVGPTPTVNLAPDASNSPQTASATTGLVQLGPAVLFSSGPIEVTTTATTGSTGGVTSTATIGAINTSGQEILTAGGLSSTCTANDSGDTGSTTVTGGRIVLQDPDPDTTGEEGEEIVILPVNPAPNTTYTGTVANVNDNFRAVFNEQIANPDGSLTVNAYHLFLLGPTAVGDLIVGTVTCGVNTQVVPTTTTTLAQTTSTTARSGTGGPVGTAGNGGPGGNLARTGTGGPGALSLGILLLAGGVGSMLLGRRRRPATADHRPDSAA